MAEAIHESAIVIDATSPLLSSPDERYIRAYRNGGATIVAPTVGSVENSAGALSNVATWHRAIRENDDLALIRRASDVIAAKQNNKLGIVLHFQGSDPLEANLDLVDAFKALGVGIIQLTYNARNRVGDGSEEPLNSGLSRFGQRLIERMNKANVIIDCSHTGERTTLDAIAASTSPVVVSHANFRSVHPAPRNISDEVLFAIASSGGLVGCVGFPLWVSSDRKPTIDKFVAHIDYAVQRVGIDHVGLGIDYFRLQHPYGADEEFNALRDMYIKVGAWDPAYYPPAPYHYPAGIETPDKLGALTQSLVSRGYAKDDIHKILGGNWLRVYEDVWG